MKSVKEMVSAVARKVVFLLCRKGLASHPENGITPYGARLEPVVRRFIAATVFLPSFLQRSSHVILTTQTAR
jgi:hypothetical protein